MRILVTGGLSYIGSYIVYKCVSFGLECVIVDDLSTGKLEQHQTLENITGKAIPLFICDLGDREKLSEVFSSVTINTVIHCAGKKCVSESQIKPLHYYDQNVAKGITLLHVMECFNVYSLIFSSSASVYSKDNVQPVTEISLTTGTTHPYAQTKLMFENICEALSRSNARWKIGILRYFNPVGAHPEGILGDRSWRNTASLFNNIVRVIMDTDKQIEVYGANYNTRDGSGIRDFVHIDDLATAHVNLLLKMSQLKGVDVWNIGTGSGTTVLEFIECCEQIVGFGIAKSIQNRREGDLDISYCSIEKAANYLNYQSHYKLTEMISHGLKFHNLI